MKFFGKIGFIYGQQIAPGINLPSAEEHDAYGDVLSNVRRWETGQEVNSDLTISNKLSILADSFLCEHMGAMRYVVWYGTAWEIKSVELNYPRAILTLGGVYNGDLAKSVENSSQANQSTNNSLASQDSYSNQNGRG